MKKLLLLILIAMIIPVNVKADCDNDEIIRLQKLANNINTNYEYDENTNKFKLTFTNLTSEMIIEDINNNRDYYDDVELVINNLDSGKYTYYVYARNKNCYESELKIKNIQLPYLNPYYASKDCELIPDYEYCSKWLPKSISYETWKTNISKKIEELKKEEKSKQIIIKESLGDKIKKFITELYITHYYIFLPLVIVSLCAIIYLKNKSDQLI